MNFLPFVRHSLRLSTSGSTGNGSVLPSRTPRFDVALVQVRRILDLSAERRAVTAVREADRVIR